MIRSTVLIASKPEGLGPEKAKCIWCREGIAPGFYDSGFDLLAISREHKQEIERLIVEYGFQD